MIMILTQRIVSAGERNVIRRYVDSTTTTTVRLGVCGLRAWYAFVHGQVSPGLKRRRPLSVGFGGNVYKMYTTRPQLFLTDLMRLVKKKKKVFTFRYTTFGRSKKNDRKEFIIKNVLTFRSDSLENFSVRLSK